MIRTARGESATQRTAVVAGLFVGACAFGIAMLGYRRGYSYDESVTVGGFVSQDMWTPFTRQIVHNNHPLFSFFEHLAWEAGADSEGGMRLLPAAFGGAAVGAVAWWCSRRWGMLAGLTGAALLAVHPLLLTYAREARGYSLLVLAAVVSTFLLIDFVEDQRAGRKLGISYVLALAIGFATHLYMAPILLAHGGLLIGRNRLTVMSASRLIAGTALGMIAYIQIPPSGGPKRFTRSFPLDAMWEVLGSGLIPLLVLGACSIAAVYAHRRDALMLVLPLAGVALMWIVVQPFHFYPRFLVVLAPGVAGAVAWAVGRRRWVAVPALVTVIAMGSHVGLPSEPGIRSAAEVVDSARAKGLSACALGGESLMAYTEPPAEIGPETECDLVVLVGSWSVPELAALEEEWGPRHEVDGVAIVAPPIVLESLRPDLRGE